MAWSQASRTFPSQLNRAILLSTAQETAQLRRELRGRDHTGT